MPYPWSRPYQAAVGQKGAGVILRTAGLLKLLLLFQLVGGEGSGVPAVKDQGTVGGLGVDYLPPAGSLGVVAHRLGDACQIQGLLYTELQLLGLLKGALDAVDGDGYAPVASVCSPLSSEREGSHSPAPRPGPGSAGSSPWRIRRKYAATPTARITRAKKIQPARAQAPAAPGSGGPAGGVPALRRPSASAPDWRRGGADPAARPRCRRSAPKHPPKSDPAQRNGADPAACPCRRYDCLSCQNLIPHRSDRPRRCPAASRRLQTETLSPLPAPAGFRASQASVRGRSRGLRRKVVPSAQMHTRLPRGSSRPVQDGAQASGGDLGRPFQQQRVHLRGKGSGFRRGQKGGNPPRPLGGQAELVHVLAAQAEAPEGGSNLRGQLPLLRRQPGASPAAPKDSIPRKSFFLPSDLPEVPRPGPPAGQRCPAKAGRNSRTPRSRSCPRPWRRRQGLLRYALPAHSSRCWYRCPR